MRPAVNVAKSLIPISQFNKGQASRIFDRLIELEEDYAMLLEAYERLENYGDKPGIPITDVMARHGISESELDEIKDIWIE